MITNISTLKAKLLPNRMGFKDELPFKDMDILDHIEKIVETSKKTGIEKCLSNEKKHLDYIAKKLSISHLQALLFSHFMEKSYDNRIEIDEIAESIKCSKVKILKYINECEELEKKKLIRCSRDTDSITFRVPRDVKDSLRKFNEFKPEKNENLTIDKFFTVLEKLFEERSKNELTFEALCIELLDIINQNMHLEFCKKIVHYDFHVDDKVLLICFCHLFGNNSQDYIDIDDLDFLYEEKTQTKILNRALTKGNHPLINSKIIVYNNNNGFMDSESWRLSDTAKKELLSELDHKANHGYKKNLMSFADIKPKEMFYNAKETESIQTLTSLLSEENYRKIQERLDGKGMRKGFACLFSGGPGTGKTETVYQIARETKRNIMMVDISATKSCWYGESEKKVKEIFDSYRTAVDNSQIAPILLFNEADAVIGKRKEFSSGNQSIDQTENTIQNIILQEMENLSGIMIATTNLTQNMDSAFERRFLYKITFDKPSVKSRINIWNSPLPDLSEDKAKELGERFELSGGQIENIARKIEVDAIISGSDLSMSTLVQYCQDESLNSLNTLKRIGFGH
jgi:ATP-dependent 26S proteasome regulatory subunit